MDNRKKGHALYETIKHKLKGVDITPFSIYAALVESESNKNVRFSIRKFDDGVIGFLAEAISKNTNQDYIYSLYERLLEHEHILNEQALNLSEGKNLEGYLKALLESQKAAFAFAKSLENLKIQLGEINDSN